MASEKVRRPMRPDDILRIRWVTDPRLSPDGTRVAYVVTMLDEKANEYRSHVYVVGVGAAADGQTGTTDVGGLAETATTAGGEDSSAAPQNDNERAPQNDNVGGPRGDNIGARQSDSVRARQLTNGPKRDTAPRWSADGRHLAFLSERGEEKRQVWVIPADGGEAWQLTKAKDGANNPAWAPDGRRLAFTARVALRQAQDGKGEEKGPDGKPLPKVRRITTLKYKSNGEGFVEDKRSHIFVANVDLEKREASEGRQLTRGDFNHGAPAWSADGTRIAFTSARHASRDRDGAGDVWVQEVGEGSEARGDQRPGRRVLRQVQDGQLRRLTFTKGPVSLPAWSPDGSMIAYLGHEDRHAGGAKNQRLWVVDVPPSTEAKARPGRKDSSASPQNDNKREPQNDIRGEPQSYDGAAPRCLTLELDRTCNTGVEPAWSHDGKSVQFGVMDSGNCHVYSAGLEDDDDAEAGKPRLRERSDAASQNADEAGTPRLRIVVGGERQVASASFACGSAVFLASDPTHPGEVFHAAEDGKGERRLTCENEAWLGEVELAKPEALAATSADGTAVQAWVMRPVRAVDPDGTEAGKPRLRGRRASGQAGRDGRDLAACLLNVHGGPHGQYGNVFFDEFQVYAAAGYAVVYGNPRGSQGYGEGFANAIRGAWGGRDWEDVTATADAIAGLDFVDQERVGVMGGSYGGYMTSWAVGHTERFKAACSERAVNNVYSMVGSSDIGFSFQTYEMGGATPFTDPERFLKMSPVHYLKSIRTPLLIIHSENDLRCPIEQAEQLYVGLKLLRRPVEFWRFPEENHEMSRAGKPRHRLKRFEVILAWFGKRL